MKTTFIPNGKITQELIDDIKSIVIDAFLQNRMESFRVKRNYHFYVNEKGKLFTVITIGEQETIKPTFSSIHFVKVESSDWKIVFLNDEGKAKLPTSHQEIKQKVSEYIDSVCQQAIGRTELLLMDLDSPQLD